MLHPRLASLLLLLSLSSPVIAQPVIAQNAASPIMVSVEGAVNAPGQYPLPERARLGEAVRLAQPSSAAYILGAALLREKSRIEQTRLKAGLLYDLKVLQADPSTPAANAAEALSQWLQTLPVTGRVPQQLEPRLIEIDPANDPPALAGDRVIYPTRPDHISVVGAVIHSCQLPHAPTEDVRHYLSACAPATVADRDLVYAVQPDGQVQELGIALWNRGPVQPLAPGAVLYVPLAQRLVRDADPDFNREFAQFLATQLLPAPGVIP
ncbi:MAG: capsule biosynthesis GfcC family protein [Pseudomonas sp.]